MDRKLKITGVALGIGTLGYWLLQEFKKSDGTVRGALRTAGRDLYTWFTASRQATQHIFSAIAAGVTDWRDERATNRFMANTGNREDRGNGGAPLVKANASIPTSSEREFKHI